MQKIVVVGGKGKMGSEVAQELAEKYEVLVVDKENFGDNWHDGASLVIDFSCAENSLKVTKICIKHRLPLVIGSTGQTQRQLQKIKCASKKIPIFMAGNFSLGIQEMKRIILGLNLCDVQDIVIQEKHHSQKKDAPSGTAKELMGVVKQKFGVVPAILSVRGGKEIGTHKISFYFGEEVLEFKHQAFSRRAFVRGAVLATEFMLSNQSAGLYGMGDLQMKG